MTIQPGAGSAASDANPYALEKSRLFVFFDVKEMSEVAEPQWFKLRQCFLAHDLTEARAVRIEGHPILHPSRDIEGPLWQLVLDSAPKNAEARQQESESRSAPSGVVVADDLHPAVVSALGGQNPTGYGRRLPALALTRAGLNLVNGQYLRPKADWTPEEAELFDSTRKGLSLKLSASGQARLNTTASEIMATIVNVTAVFPTGSPYGLIIVELSVNAPTGHSLDALWIQEALHILSNRNRRDASNLAVFKHEAHIALGSLMASVFPLAYCEATEWSRLFTYTMLILKRFPADHAADTVDSLTYRCARHYTASYRLDPDKVAMGVQRPFDSIAHMFGLEGAASIVDGSDPFLGHQFSSRVDHLYLWLIALAYHEHVYLIDLVQNQVPLVADETIDFPVLSGIIKDFLKFRMLHRMPIVSDIEMHNEVYLALRKSLRLDLLSEKLAGDVTAVERFFTEERARQAARAAKVARQRAKLRHEQRKASARRDALPSAGIVFGLTFLAFSSLVEKVEKLVFSGQTGPAGQTSPHEDWSVLIIATSVALLAAGLDYKKKKRDFAAEDADEASVDTVADEALNVAEDGIDGSDLQNDLTNVAGAGVAQSPSS